MIFLRDVELRVRHGPRGIVRGRGVGFDDPEWFVDAVLAQQIEIEAAESVDGVGIEVDVECERVEVVVVGGACGVGGEDLEVAVEEEFAPVVGIPPVGDGGQVDDHIGVDLVRDVVGDFHQLDEVFDGAAPRLEVGVPDVGFVPDDPVLDAAGMARHQLADEGRPQVFGIVVGKIQTLRDADAFFSIDGPSRCSDDQADDFASGSAFRVDGGIGNGEFVPFVRVVGLDLVPLEGDARPAGTEGTGGVGRGIAFDDAETAVGNTGGEGGGGGEEGEGELKRKT